jgi:hypothetical protein
VELRVNAATELAWSKPYLGVEHLGGLRDERSATLEDRGSSFRATFWRRGVSLWDANELVCSTYHEAKAACDRWVVNGVA